MPGRWRALALAWILTLTLGNCTSSDESTTSTRTPEPWRGGTLRVAVDMQGPVWWDPAGYVGSLGWGIARCCLLRTLMSYSGLPVDEGGADLRPDIAAEQPNVSEDGLAWTFRLKEGLGFGPPFGGTEIVASDVVRALERLGHQDWLPPDNYALLFDIIDGFEEFRNGESASIRGLETPDPHTLVVRLTEPTGDLPDRFALPGTAPVPEDVPTDRPRHYIQYLVASGPYMIDGSEDLDFTRPRERQQPVSGFIPMKSVALVRNPMWDPSTDDLRSAYVDRIELELFPTPHGFVHEMARRREIASNIADRMARGDLDLNTIYLGRAAVKAYEREPELRDHISSTPRGVVYYLPLRLAVPPLDDLHVRKAIALALDRAELLRLFEEGDRFGSIAWHLAPDVTERGLLADYRPAWMSDPEGDLNAARAEMRLSSYDADGDGVCDDSICRRIPSVDLEGQSVLPAIEDELGAIGIGFRNERFPPVKFMGMYRTANDPSERLGTVLVQWLGWAFDYPNGSAMFVPLADSSQIGGFANLTLLGASPSQLQGWGYAVDSVPSVDDRIDRCLSLPSADQPACWAELDTHLMEQVVPWVPLVFERWIDATSPRVATYSYDSARDFPALDQISLVPGSE